VTANGRHFEQPVYERVRSRVKNNNMSYSDFLKCFHIVENYPVLLLSVYNMYFFRGAMFAYR